MISIRGNKGCLVSLYEKENMTDIKHNCYYCKQRTASPVISNYSFSFISVGAWFSHDAFEKFLFKVESLHLVSKQNTLSENECAVLSLFHRRETEAQRYVPCCLWG